MKIYRNILTAVFVIYVLWLSFFSELLINDFKYLIFYLFAFVFFSFFILKRYFRLAILARDNIIFWSYIAGLAISSLRFLNGTDLILESSFRSIVLVAVPLYFVSKYLLKKEDVLKIIKIWTLSASVVALIGIMEFFLRRSFLYESIVPNFFYQRYIYLHRMMSTFIHPNILGAYMITTLPLIFINKNFKKGVSVFIFVLILISIILTFSRGTWLALFIMAAIYFSISKRPKRVFILFALLLSFTLFSQFIPGKNIFLKELKRRFSVVSLYNYTVTGHRIYNYTLGLNMFKKHPIIGIGWGSFRARFDEYSDEEFPYEIKIPDSVYLMHLSEVGLIGFLPFSLLLLQVIYRRKKRFSALTFSFYCLAVNFFTFDGFLWISTLSLFWLLLGLLSNKELENL